MWGIVEVIQDWILFLEKKENNENKDSNFNTAIVDPSSSSIFEKNNIMKDKRS